tara:strand:- start:11704 stop:12648 length:945 start_codon:yes stop_codon:yes gene_type:complete
MSSKKTFKEMLMGENEDCTPLQDFIDSKIPINDIPPNSGLFNSPVCRTRFSYMKPSGCWMKKNQGAYIAMGQVPPGGLSTGYGARGIPAESIDLVVGRNSSANGGDGPKAKSVVDNNFASDAARIYISRLCDIDQIFGLESQVGGNDGRGLIARSGIGLKADGIRIVGREGVKITTGRMSGAKFGLSGETNSLGGKIAMRAPKIELIAGNNYRDVQGVAMGNRTRNSLRELHTLIGELWSAVFSLGLTQAGFNSVLGVTPISWHAAAAPNVTQQQFSRVLNSLYQTRTNAEMWKFNYLQASGPDYIVSRNVKTN